MAAFSISNVPYLYSFPSNAIVKAANFSVLPPGNLSALAFSHDSLYFVAAGGKGSTEKVFTIYKYSGGASIYSKLLEIPQSTLGAAIFLSFVGENSEYLISVCYGSPFYKIAVYSRNGDVFTEISSTAVGNFSNYPPNSVRWSNSGKYLIVGYTNTNLINIWKFSNGTMTLVVPNQSTAGIPVAETGSKLLGKGCFFGGLNGDDYCALVGRSTSYPDSKFNGIMIFTNNDGALTYVSTIRPIHINGLFEDCVASSTGEFLFCVEQYVVDMVSYNTTYLYRINGGAFTLLKDSLFSEKAVTVNISSFDNLKLLTTRNESPYFNLYKTANVLTVEPLNQGLDNSYVQKISTQNNIGIAIESGEIGQNIKVKTFPPLITK